MVLHCLFSPAALSKGVLLHFSEGQRDVSTEKWMVFGPVDLAHSEKLTLIQKHLKKTNCSSLDLWM
jgi:hypothetical protein